VTTVAVRLANKLKEKGYNVDVGLVEAGALLHDVGRSQTHDVDHAAVGGMIARNLGLSESVVRIIERHIGAGIPPKEAQSLGLPEGVYTPETLEEKIVSYADKLISGRKEVDISVTIEDFAMRLGWDHPAIERLHRLQLEMETLLAN
jgi:uncharacterized protein